jgi:CPA2 family monovalent cation:H+ antiporter-2
VLFLLFGVGLHFSVQDLWSVRRVALPGAAAQMAASSTLGYLVGRTLGWSGEASLVLGLAVSVASTVVLLRALMDNGLLDTDEGRVAVGWLVFQDIATIAMLILLPTAVGRGEHSVMAIAAAIAKAAVLLVLMVTGGRRVVPWLLKRVVFLQSRELFILAGLTIAIGVALLSSAIFGLSLALGAFLAGVVVKESPYHHQVGADLLPFQEAFAVIFFVSVGMLVDPRYLVSHWADVATLSAVVILGNAAIGTALGFALPASARTALVIGAGLSQIGEFSFIVGEAGVALGVLDTTQYSLILAVALVSIVVNTVMFRLVEPIGRALRARPRLWRALDRHGPSLPPLAERLSGHVVIVGWGRVGRHVADVIGALGIQRLVIESNSALAEQLTRANVLTLFGEAGNSEILAHADLPDARALVLTVPDESTAALAIVAARRLAPHIPIVARAATEEGARHLSALGVEEVVRPEFEGGLQVLRRTLLMLDFPVRRIQEYVETIREAQTTSSDTQDMSLRLIDRLAASDLDLQWVPIADESPLARMTIAETSLRPKTGASIVALARGGELMTNPSPDHILLPSDDVAIIGTAQQLEAARLLFGHHSL